MLAKLMFICSSLAVSLCQWIQQAFNQFTPKVCIIVQIFFLSESVLLAQHETSVVCPKHSFMPCRIAVQYVARVLHFSASSFIILIFFFFVCACLHVCSCRWSSQHQLC